MIAVDPWAVVWYSLGLILALILLVVLVVIVAGLTISASRWLNNVVPASKRRQRLVKRLQQSGRAKASRIAEVKYRQEFGRRTQIEAFVAGAEWGMNYALTQKDK